MNDISSINNTNPPLENKIAKSGLLTIDLEQYYPKNEVVEIDIKNFLFREMILKESEFKQHIATHDWQKYKDKVVAVHCTTDALLPQWAFMMVTNALYSFTTSVFFGSKQEAKVNYLLHQIHQLDYSIYTDKKVLVKGCSHEELPDVAYLEITKQLLPVVQSLMFGEACSNVPIYKRKR